MKTYGRASALLCSLALAAVACAAPEGSDSADDADADARGDGDGDEGSGGGTVDPSSGGTTGNSGGSSNNGTGAAPSSTGGTTGNSSRGSAEIKLPYTEDFEDGVADGFIDSVSDELVALGSWSVVDDTEGKVYQQSATTDDATWAVGGDYHWTDQHLQTRFKITTGAADFLLHLAVRLSDFDHYYYIELRADRIKLRLRNAGSVDLMTWDIPVPIVDGEWHTVALSAIGTTIAVDFDGAEVITTTDAQLANGGIGLAIIDGAVAFDDLVVSPE